MPSGFYKEKSTS